MPATEKKPAYYRLSSQVLLPPKIRILASEIWLRPKLGFLGLLGLKKGLKDFFGLKTSIFQILKSKTSKNDLKTKTGLKDYITGFIIDINFFSNQQGLI